MSELSIDERLKFLLTSTESLHTSCQELHAAAAESRRQAEEYHARTDAQQKAMLAAIRAYLDGTEPNS